MCSAMVYTCVFLLLVLVPFSTGERSDVIEGLKFYKNLTDRAVGLKQYAENLSVAVDYMKTKAVHRRLDENEKAVLDRLGSGLRLVTESLDKGTKGILKIKEQITAVQLILTSLPGIKTKEEILELVTQVFSTFSMYTKELKDLEDGLRDANTTLQNSLIDLDVLVQALGKLQTNSIANKDFTQNVHLASMAVEATIGALAVGVFGATLVPVLIPAGLMCAFHGWSIKTNNDDFWVQQDEFSERIEGYEAFSEKTKTVCEGLDAKIQQMQDVYVAFGTTKTVAGSDFTFSNPQAQCDVIQQMTEALIDACETFQEG